MWVKGERRLTLTELGVMVYAIIDIIIITIFLHYFTCVTISSQLLVWLVTDSTLVVQKKHLPVSKERLANSIISARVMGGVIS